MLYIIRHPYRSIRKQIWPCHKNGQDQHRVIIWKKLQGMGIQPLDTSWWQHFKAFIIPIILYKFQKDPFCLIILYDVLFYFIHAYIATGKEETNLGDTYSDGSRKVTLITGCIFIKIALLCHLILCTFFSRLYTCTLPLGRGRQGIRARILMSTGRPHHFGHLLQVKKKLFNLWLYTHLSMI